jgi:hypothetical protein
MAGIVRRDQGGQLAPFLLNLAMFALFFVAFL